MRSFLLLLPFVATLLASPLVAAPTTSAQSPEAPAATVAEDAHDAWDALAGSTLFRFLDNDAFAHEDDGYSHGLSLALVSPRLERFSDGPVPAWVGRHLDRFSFLEGEGVRTISHSISQRLFTPSDIEAAVPDPRDLPYSALLYLLSTATVQDEDRLRALSLGLGVVGPLALGEEAQRTVHRWIGSTEPEGWDSQVGNEPLLHLALEQRDRLTHVGSRGGFNADVLSELQAAIGTLQTAAHASLTVRGGYRVPDDFQTPPPFLGEETIGLRPTTPDDGRFGMHGFVNVGLTAIGRAVWLDGRLLDDDDPSVGRDPFVVRGSVGLVTRWRGTHLTLAFEHASLPFDPPDGASSESFARIGLTFGS